MSRPNKTSVRGLYKRRDGRFRIDLRWTDRKGRAQRHVELLPIGTPLGAAKARAQQVLEDALAGRDTKPKADTVVLLSHAFDAYLIWVQTNKPKSFKDRTSIAKGWVDAVGDVAIGKLDAELVELYKAQRKVDRAGHATINRGVAVVKHMVGLAVRSNWAWMTRERADAIRDVEMLDEPDGRQRPIAPTELDAIFAAFTRVDSRFCRRVVAAALLTGCRLGELIGLRVGNVDLRRKRIDLTHTKQKRRHEIVITPPLADLLKEALAESKGGFVFVSRRGEPYTVSGFSKQFAKVAERANCGDITFHDLRRHVGTTLINDGERLEVVSKLLGHSTVAVTQRSYAHLSTEAVKGAFEHLGKMFATPLPPAAKVKVRTGKKSRRSSDGATDS